MTPTIAGGERPSVFFVAGFGDQVMSLPAMRALGAIFPNGLQLLLGEGMLSFFYRGLPVRDVTRVWYADFADRRIDVERILAHAPSCDSFIGLSPWVSPSVVELATRLGARRTLGHMDGFDDVVPYDSRVHMFDLLFSIPQRLRSGLSLDEFSYPPRFSPAAEAAALRFVREHVPPGHRLLFVHPETHTEKMWSQASLSWVLQRFLDAYPDVRVFVASVMWYPLALTRHWDRIVLVDEHLEFVLAALRYADLFLGVDSCFLHAADLYRIPGVALFGPTEPHRWGFRLSPRGRSVWGNGSMRAIERETVLEALLETAEEIKGGGADTAEEAELTMARVLR